MDVFSVPNWSEMLSPETPLLEILVRGSLTYLALFALLRLVLKREAGALGMTDLLVIVLIADAAQNSMSGSYESVTDGLLLVLVIVGWAFLLDLLGTLSPTIGRVIRPAPLPLVRDGQMLRREMRREFITEEELMSAIRLQGIDDLADVKRAYVEPDGRVSVISGRTQQGDRGRRRGS